MLYLGADIASVDGNKPVDWVAAKAAGLRFVYFRANYSTWKDPTWKHEADRARDAGLIVGAYLFPVMNKSAPPAEEQVASFHESIGKLKLGDLPPTLDVEFPGGVTKTGHTREELLEWITLAAFELKKRFGIWPMVYTSQRVWDGEDTDSLNADAAKHLSTSFLELANCPLWLAHYPYKARITAVTNVETLPLPGVPKLWVDATNVWIHQYQGDALKFPGFSSTEDLNRFFDLRKGSQGERVRWIQRKLRCVVDGDFGPGTENAVIAFQRVNSLIPDGIVGPKTFAYLCWVKV